MSTLIENVQKVKDAHANLKTAIAAKGVTVPENTTLTQMPALVDQIQIGTTPEQTPAANFYNRSHLEILNVKPVIYTDFTTTTSLYSCFNNCLSVHSLVLPDGFGQAASNIAFCFYKCLSLSSLHLPDGFGQNATATALAFGSCSALTDITGNPNFEKSVSFSASKELTHDSLMVVINGLKTVATT